MGEGSMMTMKRQVQILLLFLVGIPFLFLLTENYRTGRSALIERIRENSLAVAQLQVARIELFLETTDQGVEGLARAVESLPALEGERIRQLLQRTVIAIPRAFGMSVALDPAATPLGRFATYVFRDNGQVRAKELVDSAYAYESHDWFTRPMAQSAALWSKQYFDRGGGDVIMITRSVPIRREGRIVGVATVDIALTGFSEHLRQLKPGGDGSVYLVNRKGAVLAHPELSIDSDKEPDAGVADLGALRPLLDNARLDAVDAMDPITRRRSWLVEHPIAGLSSEKGGQDWSLIVSWPLDDRLRSLQQFGLHLLILYLVLGGGALLFLNRAFEDVIGRPIRRLARQAQRISRGEPPLVAGDESGPLELRELSQSLSELEQQRAGMHTSTREGRTA
jgi:phosphoserine phosphatase RsbU/P